MELHAQRQRQTSAAERLCCAWQPAMHILMLVSLALLHSSKYCFHVHGTNLAITGMLPCTLRKQKATPSCA